MTTGSISISEQPTTTAASDARERVVLDDNGAALLLFGQSNTNLKTIEREVGLTIAVRGNELTLVGAADRVALGRSLLEQLYQLAKKGKPLATTDIARAVGVLAGDQHAQIKDVFRDTVLVASRARPIQPKGLAQKRYIDAIRQEDIVFGIGPAGTGKTYLAMAAAVRALLDKEVKRIVLARPAVEAGEKLGFLPGTMAEKVNPYLRPLYDALHDMMDFERAEHLVEKGVIEVAPLAFMRGRTLNDAFVNLDEAKNTTTEQMKMFLTRLGFNSKAVITGDVTQVDLPNGQKSGLLEARELLEGIEGITFCSFTEIDVVRHPLIQKIIKAYDARDAAKKAAEALSKKT
ncbi:MAG: Phosphate starvation-inducible protein PhoH, predicted ATPase [Myxococcales bacterium]|nr:Phosphate starvation-inducible protein PhoH, predicted ATPase [Myxococcales bacterium]